MTLITSAKKKLAVLKVATSSLTDEKKKEKVQEEGYGLNCTTPKGCWYTGVSSSPARPRWS